MSDLTRIVRESLATGRMQILSRLPVTPENEIFRRQCLAMWPELEIMLYPEARAADPARDRSSVL